MYGCEQRGCGSISDSSVSNESSRTIASAQSCFDYRLCVSQIRLKFHPALNASPYRGCRFWETQLLKQLWPLHIILFCCGMACDQDLYGSAASRGQALDAVTQCDDADGNSKPGDLVFWALMNDSVGVDNKCGVVAPHFSFLRCRQSDS